MKMAGEEIGYQPYGGSMKKEFIIDTKFKGRIMPRLENGVLRIGFDETEYHWWNKGKSVLDTLIELNAPLEVLQNYCLREPNLSDTCPHCHKPTVQSYVIYCQSCFLWK